MVNILPHKAQKELHLMYYTRFFGTFFLVAAFVVGIGGGVLIPAYFLAQEEAETSRRYAEALQQTLTLGEAGNAGKSLPVLSEQIKLMKQYRADSVIASSFEKIVAVIPNNVSVKKIGFKFSSITEGQVTLSGNADTRAALLAFVDSLKKEPLFKGVAVPVADLVTDNDLPFSLTFSLLVAKP